MTETVQHGVRLTGERVRLREFRLDDLDATRTIIVFGFTTLGLHRISAAIGPDNAASIALVNRLGFTEEGRLRDHVFTNGAWRDSILYSLLAHEWLQDR